MNKMIICFLILASTLQSGLVFGKGPNEELSKLKTEMPTAAVTALFSVNPLTNVTLSVKIPEKYKLIDNKELIFMNMDIGSIGTEAVMIKRVTGNQVSAKKLLEVKAKRFKRYRNVKTVQNSYNNFKNDKYDEAKFTSSYDHDNDKFINSVYIACGPNECAIVEYFAITQNEQKDIQKINEFFNANVEILKSDLGQLYPWPK